MQRAINQFNWKLFNEKAALLNILQLTYVSLYNILHSNALC
jgi:hypothetical protein